MAERCAELVRQKFSLTMIVARHAALYSELLVRNSRPGVSDLDPILSAAAPDKRQGEPQLELVGSRRDRPGALDVVLRLAARRGPARTDDGV